MSQLRSIQPIKSGLGLRELQAVLAVAELGSFRRAAAALGYTQSALSHQVSALEKQVTELRSAMSANLDELRGLRQALGG